MFKRHDSSNMKLSGKSGYLFALALPIISFSGEGKASTQIASENKFLATINQSEDTEFKKSKSENTLNFNSGNIAQRCS